jgi:hypothetical protein
VEGGSHLSSSRRGSAWLHLLRVRSAQRKTRNDSVRVIRHLFDDLIRNKLQVALFATEIEGQDWRPAAQKAVLEFQKSLSQIESEALSLPKDQRVESSS